MTISSESRGARAALLGILAFAAALRFWGIANGIPYAIGVDEPQVLNRALVMMRTGDFNPHFYDYPALYIYVQMAVACVRFMAGAMMGYWSSLSQAALPEFVVWGRAVTAALGTATVFCVYRMGLRWSIWHALLAAGLLAVLPMHVRESHFILTDVPVTFFVALTGVLAMRAGENPTVGAFALAGVAAGLAAGTKYPGAIALMMPLTAAWMTRDAQPSRVAVAATAIIASAGAFLLAAPYTLLDLPGFLDGYGKLMVSYTGAGSSEPGWSLYLKHLRITAHWPAFIAIQAGFVLALARTVRGPGRLPWAVALGFPLVFFLVVSRQSLVFGRYLLPVLPFACLLAAIAVVAAVRSLPHVAILRPVRKGLLVGLTALVTLPPAFDAVRFNLLQSRQGTAALAYDWLNANVEAGTVIAVEGTDLVLMYSKYQLLQVPQLRLRPYEFYTARGVRYMVASSQCYGAYLENPSRFPEQYREYMTLFARAREVVRFSPSGDHPGAELRILEVPR